MSRQATIIARKAGVWSSLGVGTSTEMREKFKREKFPGFDRVHLLDTSGGHRRKKGSAAPAKPKPKAKAAG